ncbi:MAG: hypothetical protein IPK58_07485 [Acidobacteria bacterium]|nr:hypothetical protein [Acidobacteriota bacterium]
MTSINYHSTDGSFLKLVYQRTGEWTLFFPDGSRVENDANGQRIIDRNSNFVEKGTVTLPTERPPPAGSTSSGVTLSKRTDASKHEDYIYRKGVGGEVLKWTVKWKEVWVRKRVPHARCRRDANAEGVQTRSRSEVFDAVEKITLLEQVEASILVHLLR